MQLQRAIGKLGDADIEIVYRPGSLGDRGVLKQIFTDQDYRVDRWKQGLALTRYYQDLVSAGKTPLIVDAGANIGASAVYFSSTYASSLVYAVEPEAGNCSLLRLNSQGRNIQTFEGAIGCADGEMYLDDPGNSDWGFTTSQQASAGSVKVDVISPNSILARLDSPELAPFIFKIDIEGGEANLFSGHLEWLDRFAMVVIELHDWMLPFQGSSQNFMRAIAARDFEVAQWGENLFCFNRAMLAGRTQAH